MAGIYETPNNGPPLKEVYAFVSRDADGQENVIGGHLGDLGWTALITGNRKTFEIFRELAEQVKARVEPGGRQTIHLLRFSGREELEDWNV